MTVRAESSDDICISCSKRILNSISDMPSVYCGFRRDVDFNGYVLLGLASLGDASL